MVGIVYYVAVYGFASATYTLTISRSEAVITLTSGGQGDTFLHLIIPPLLSSLSCPSVPAAVPQVGLQVFKHLARMFQIYLGFESASLRITLTSTNGDCDLFVKLGAKGGGPGPLASPFDYDFRSTNAGKAVDSVSVGEADVCTDCVVSIMVFGYYSSTFSLLAVLSDDTVQLTDGLPQKGSVASGRIQYYSYTLTSPIFGPNSTDGMLKQIEIIEFLKMKLLLTL